MSEAARLLSRSVRTAKQMYAWGRSFQRRWQTRDLRRTRAEAEAELAAIIRSSPHAAVGSRALVDGMFDNPGYWYRLAVLMGGLGLGQARTIGLTGPHSVADSRATLKTFGAADVISFDTAAKPDRALRDQARAMAATLTRPEDVLRLELPHGMPAAFLYDATLKRQRSAAVNVTDPLLEDDIHECLAALRCAEAVIDRFTPDVVCLSHALNTRYTALACVAANAGVSPVVLFGNYGVPRLWRVKKPGDVLHSMDRPSGADLDRLSPEKAADLERVGREYLRLRFAGRSTDIAGSRAFSRLEAASPADLRRALGWHDDRPVVAVYASNWFDFPHAFGMTAFRDFLDWIHSTLDAAERNTRVNWLFKAHPVDSWYGGITLQSLLPERLPPNVRLVPDDWSGADTMALANAMITYQGTGAIEYAAQQKPVLLPDRGWYDDCGFTVTAASREDYLRLLGTPWFDGRDMSEASRRAAIFAGWYFCIPAWQETALLPDDSKQLAMYPSIRRQLRDERPVVEREMRTMREWYASGEYYYHTYKMRHADRYRLSNVS